MSSSKAGFNSRSIYPKKRPRGVNGYVLLLLLFSGALVCAAIVWIQSAGVTIHRAGTANRLQHIWMAMEAYHQLNGCYPPQYVVDGQGRPAHSWRVLLLPRLGYGDLFRRYSFDEPWNGPHNRLLAAEMPEEYRSPFQDSKSTIAQYVGIAGKNTPWQGTTPLRFKDLQRDESNPLIWFVEAANSDINWMEPRDIPLEQALVGINVPGGGGLQSNYSEGLPAQMKPSGRNWVPVGVSPDAFRAMLTLVDGKESGEGKGSKRPQPSRAEASSREAQPTPDHKQY